jgi:hypothetical protein
MVQAELLILRMVKFQVNSSFHNFYDARRKLKKIPVFFELITMKDIFATLLG